MAAVIAARKAASPHRSSDVPHATTPSRARRLKRVVLGALDRAGVSAHVRDGAWRSRRVAILCYHGVALDDEHHWDPTLYVSAATLESRLSHLARHDYTVLSLDDAVRRLATATLPPRSVVLTFDDGYHDFRARALPLLRRFGMPATVYLTTFYSEFHRPVFGIFCSYLLFKSRRREIDVEGLLPGVRRWALSSRAAREELRLELVRHADERGFSAAEKDAFARSLAERLDVDYDGLAARRILHLMTPEDVRDVAAHGIGVELHTHRHRVPRQRDRFLAEIAENAERIRSMTGRPPRHFCYPSGEYETMFLPWLAAAGVVSATTCESGLAGPGEPALLLPRLVDTEGTTALEFAAMVAGTADWMPRRRP